MSEVLGSKTCVPVTSAGQHVRSELETLERAPDDPGQRAHRERLGQPGHTLEQHVAAAQQRHQQRLHQPVLPDHDLAHGALDFAEPRRRPST